MTNSLTEKIDTKGQREQEIDSINAANEVIEQMTEEIKSIVKLTTEKHPQLLLHMSVALV